MTLPPIPHGNRLLVVVGPSGAGKDSVLRAWTARLGHAPVRFARRLITRPPDPNEAHESVDEATFGQLRSSGALATWWSAHGLLYGVRKETMAPLAAGEWVVLNGSRAHLDALRRQAPDLHAVEITAPADVLAARLAARGREGERAVRQRLARRADASVDLQVMNDGPLDQAVDALHAWWLAAGGR